MRHGPERVLLVEDDPQVGALMAEILKDGGYLVDGPHPSLPDAIGAIADHFPDCAVLDVRLRGGDAALIADDLERYDIPFLFCSGLAPADRLARRFPHAPFVPKTALGTRLLSALERTLH